MPWTTQEKWREVEEGEGEGDLIHSYSTLYEVGYRKNTAHLPHRMEGECALIRNANLPGIVFSVALRSVQKYDKEV